MWLIYLAFLATVFILIISVYELIAAKRIDDDDDDTDDL